MQLQQYQSAPLATLQPHHPHPSSHQQPTPTHTVPFGQPPAQPSSLAHGFGLSASTSWGSSTPATPVGGWRSNGWGSPSPARSSPVPVVASAGRRRRRSETPESEDGMEERAASAGGRGKKMRVGGTQPGMGEEERTFLPGGPTAKDGADLGKALASLPKDSLLTILTSLITTNPALRPTIQALLPPPSLTTTLTALTTLERAVVSSLPTGLSLRDPYIWGRVRIPLETYVTESKTFLTSFCPAVLPPHLASDESHHPSTTFALLHALSSSLRRLEVVLPPSPSPIDTHLLPYLLNAWHIFLTRLSTAVNQEGKIVSAGMLRGWFARIDELCVDSPGIGIGGRREGSAKKALEGVRERMRKEVGWVVGIKEVGVGMMEDEEEL